LAQKYLVRLNEVEEDVAFELRRENGCIEVRREDAEEWRVCELSRVGSSELFVLMVDSRPTELYLERRRGGARVTIGRHIFNCDVGPWRPPGQRVQAPGAAHGAFRLTAPMTGSIVEVRCQAGDTVTSGQVLLVIESMKMNNELRSPRDGIVESVPVVAGGRVVANDLLVALRAVQA
jgi:biotin carboxyl carrier protein